MAKDKPKGQDVETMTANQILDMLRALRDRIRAAGPAERPALREELAELERAHERAVPRDAAEARRAAADEYARLNERMVLLGQSTTAAGERLQAIEMELERPLPSRDPVVLAKLGKACTEAAELIAQRRPVDDELSKVSARIFELRAALGL